MTPPIKIRFKEITSFHNAFTRNDNIALVSHELHWLMSSNDLQQKICLKKVNFNQKQHFASVNLNIKIV